MTKLRGVLVLCFSYFRDNSNLLETYLKTYFQGPTPSLEVKTRYIRHSMSLQFLVNPKLESMDQTSLFTRKVKWQVSSHFCKVQKSRISTHAS
jgi:hypothetical protein